MRSLSSYTINDFYVILSVIIIIKQSLVVITSSCHMHCPIMFIM